MDDWGWVAGRLDVGDESWFYDANLDKFVPDIDLKAKLLAALEDHLRDDMNMSAADIAMIKRSCAKHGFISSSWIRKSLDEVAINPPNDWDSWWDDE